MALNCDQCGFVVTESRPQAGRLLFRCPQCRAPMNGKQSPAQIKVATRTPAPAAQAVRTLNLPAHLEALRWGEPGSVESESQFAYSPNPDFESSAMSDTHPGRGQVELFDIPQGRGASHSCPEEDEPHGALLQHSIPGFRIDGVIGHGGMGTVYLARQLSLDRPVALKVMSKAWASDAVFVARFIREAYAAAQLNHTNAVQIYDIGEYQDHRYFSMEYVAGRSLADLLKSRGKLDTETAVEYVLQAARGLKHAHDRGIIHRDIKPDNLLLDVHGVVKVADLGLVKTPDLLAHQDTLAQSGSCETSGLHTLPSDMTGLRMALGTPAYMAPEQCRDAATVDHRADIYSLGCTLYALITGGQPFRATDSTELMKKHAYECPVAPELVNARIPAEVSKIILKMMAKKADQRYRTMADVIRTLESWLGLQSRVRFIPREDQIAEVELLSARFAGSPAAILRSKVVSGFFSVAAIFAVLLVFFGQTAYSFGVAGMVLQSALGYFVLNGYSRKTYLFGRVRGFVLGMSVGDAIVALGGVGLFMAFLWMSGLLVVWFGFGLIGIAVAVALRFGLDQSQDLQRFPVLQAADKMLKRLRRQGVSGAESRQFFAKCSGKNWEEFFESVFGFELKLAVRSELRGGMAGERSKYAAWREPVVTLLNHFETQRKKHREREMLKESEYRRLLAAGVPRSTARQRSAQAAEQLVERAGTLHSEFSSPTIPQQATLTMGEPVAVSTRRNWGDLLGNILLGPPIRAVLAAVLIAACGWWVYQNDLLRFGPRGETTPLEIVGIPFEFTTWCDTANVGWGAMLLMASLFFRGHRCAALSLLGAAIAVFGHKLGIRTVEPVRDYHVGMLLGTVLALIGYRLGRRV